MVKPLQTLVDKKEHWLMYMVELYLDPRRSHQDFGNAIMKEFEDLRLHLVLPGVLDINLVMDQANRSLQHLGVNLWAAAGVRKRGEITLGGLVLRQKTSEPHKKKSEVAYCKPCILSALPYVNFAACHLDIL